MHIRQRTFAKSNTKISDLIIENQFILLVLEHFEIDFAVDNKTIESICNEYNINEQIFTAIINIYNGFTPSKITTFTSKDIADIIKVLKNTHLYYKQDKYPDIQNLITKLYQNNNSAEILLIEKFFNQYFNEVVEHLDYEDNVAFPYFSQLLNEKESRDNNFSVDIYKHHHTDIESKLADLKNLLLKHISLKNNFTLRRKLLFSLFELEFDLNAHSLIEENILIPLIKDIEKDKNA